MVKEATATPPNRTAFMLFKRIPFIVITDPMVADVGLNEVITGLRSVNPDRLSVRSKLLTNIFPLAPTPTVAVITVSD